jgi:hypothetical protein
MRKLMLAFAPLLVLVAVAATPALAQANTRQYGTEAKGVFTAFTKAEKITDAKVSKDYTLAGEAGGVECSTFSSKGTDENVTKENAKKEKVKVGKSLDTLTFDDCVGTGGLAGCTPNGTGIIEGEVENEVIESGLGVEIKILKGFTVECKGILTSAVTGDATGTQAEKSNILKFAASTGLTFAGKAATITGESSTITETGAKSVVIN